MLYILSTYGRYHAPQAAEALSSAGVQVELHLRDRKIRSVPGTEVRRGNPFARCAEILLRLAGSPELERGVIEELDLAVARRLQRSDAASTLFHGFSLYCRESLRQARRAGIGCAVERSGAHVVVQRKLVDEERERLGMKHSTATQYYASRAAVDRMIEEYELADRIIVSSEFCKETFLSAGVSAEKLEVAALGTNFSPQGWEPRKTRPFAVLSIGSEIERKGMYDVLVAWQMADIKDSILYLRSPVLSNWEPLLKEKGSRKIKVLPAMQRAQLERYYRKSAVFCLLSIEDGFGLVVAEAMSFGCPVIVSRNVGAKDMVSDGQDGFIVDIRNPEAVAEKLNHLRDNPDVLQTMSRNAYEKARRYSWTRYAESVLTMWSRTARASALAS